jgi:hypothetical protein
MKSKNVIRGRRPTQISQIPVRPAPLPAHERKTLTTVDVKVDIAAIIRWTGIAVTSLIGAVVAAILALSALYHPASADAAKTDHVVRKLSTAERVEAAGMILITGETAKPESRPLDVSPGAR